MTLKQKETDGGLIVDGRYEDGTVAAATGIAEHDSDPHPPVISSIIANIEDLNGVQRVFVNPGGPVPGWKTARLRVVRRKLHRENKWHGIRPFHLNPDDSARASFKNWKGTGGLSA